MPLRANLFCANAVRVSANFYFGLFRFVDWKPLTLLRSVCVMKRVHILMVLFSSIAAPVVVAQDAATEVQEGNVEQWIEYYKKERGLSNEIVTQEKGVQNPAPQEARENEGGGASTQPAAADAED